MDLNFSNPESIDGLFMVAHEGSIYDTIISKMEKVVIEKALTRTFGNKIKAAKILGINRNTLHKKIKELNIEVRKFK